MLDSLIFVVIGVVLGTFTGLTPGIHVNTVIIVILSLLPVLLERFSVHGVIALIIAMSVVHTFVDYIPSILLGAPMEDSVLSVLPGHRLLLQGRGYEAIHLTVLGSLGATVVSGAVLPVGIVILPVLYSYARSALPYILSFVLLYMVYTERELKRRTYSILLIIYSGFLGYLILGSNVLPPKYALFPTLTGLFGIPILLTSMRANPKIPKQELIYSESTYTAGIAMGSAGGILAGLLPSIGASQIALIIQNIFGKDDEKEFLVAIGGVNTADAIYALFALYLIGTSRSGASIAVEHIMTDFTTPDFIFIISIVLLTTFFATSITLGLARIFVSKVQCVDYSLFSKVTIAFLGVLILAFTGWIGMLIAVTATSIGLIAPSTGIKRSHCMSVLIIPTILYFL
ncbi:MAG: tripartite tricarboxylate transporter permease [Candidatus Hydrothermarchaeales archaeon]